VVIVPGIPTHPSARVRKHEGLLALLAGIFFLIMAFAFNDSGLC